MMRLHQGSFGGTRSLSGGGEAYRLSDAADAVQVAITVGDLLGNPTVAVRHAISRDDCVFDLALKRGREAVPDYCKPGFELIVMHGVFSLVARTELPRSTLIEGQVSRLIWYVERNLGVVARRAHDRSNTDTNECQRT